MLADSFEDAICARLRTILSPARFRHSQGVIALALELSEHYGANKRNVFLAAALHDIARELPSDGLLNEARNARLTVDPWEERVPVLLHGKIGALLAEREWGIRDPEVLDAIRQHITGDACMSLTAQIVFLADFAELGRNFASSRFARELCRVNRIRALEYVFNQEIMFILNQGFILHPKTVEARNHLLTYGDLILPTRNEEDSD